MTGAVSLYRCVKSWHNLFYVESVSLWVCRVVLSFSLSV